MSFVLFLATICDYRIDTIEKEIYVWCMWFKRMNLPLNFIPIFINSLFQIVILPHRQSTTTFNSINNSRNRSGNTVHVF